MEVLKKFFQYKLNNKQNKIKYDDVHYLSENILKKIVNIKNIEGFRSNEISNHLGSLTFPDTNRGIWFDRGVIKHYFLTLKQLYFKKKKIFNFLKKNNLKYLDFKEDSIGKPIAYKFLNFCETGTNIQNNFYISLFKKYIDQIRPRKIIEIGGGFGKLLFNISKYYKPNEYSMIELPMASSIAYFYLKKKIKDKGINFFYENQKIDKNLLNQNINIFSSEFLFEDINLFTEYDLLINTESFMHMSVENIEFYVNLIKKNKIKYILVINRLINRRKGEAKFNDIFVANNLKIIDSLDLNDVLEDMHLKFYRNCN